MQRGDRPSHRWCSAFRRSNWRHLHYRRGLRDVLAKAHPSQRIPVVKAAAEVLKEDERGSAFRAEAPVCVADPISLDEAGWSRDVGVFRHIYLLSYRWGCYVHAAGNRAAPFTRPAGIG